MSRDLDITVYGATGFVGELVAEHLAQAAPEGTVIALAGRSEPRLRAVRDRLGERAAEWPLVVADSSDGDSLRAMAQRSRVVVSTVGPYQRHGLPLVLACAEAGTDYADLTGEVLFVREAIEQAHEVARRSGARIVVSCGFDSVPSDLGVHLLHRAAQEAGAGGLTDTTMWVREAKGGFSGGTVDSMRGQLRQMADEPHLRRVVADPFALSGGRSGAPGQRDVMRPFVEQDSGRWTAPFVMASYNTRVVRRSDALRDGAYGPAFRYREVIGTGRGWRGAVRARLVAGGLGALAGSMMVPGLRSLVDRALPSPGEGPSRETREAGSFRTETITTTQDGRRWAATVAAQGDPGYAATSVELGQAALVLLATRGEQGRSGGVLTPAVALGDDLVAALRAQGFTLEVRKLGDEDLRAA
ncbi:enoyl-ACP reductase [Serinicoccus sp. CNJ-927]|uniref:saccharopine dehydrogenase family protein n=1 Tax=Serinicoccus sp. CNJ-927 TaxID=1904970 RepID=UPI0009677C6B|nr:saccharopine dehydrogenase NADP-binding domain-containing protein [Serinicoccus sp. CNJ-927]OLT44616.1 enoyl-ACP reductase [Serinicoccus sp. CNJ-927]